MTNLLLTYVHLAHDQKFVAGVANDYRSYDSDVFFQALRIAERQALMTSAECRQFSDFIVLVNQTRLKSATQEDEVEVPEEYLGKLVTCFSILISCRSDPILYTVMEDPVILPSSQIVIDRKTIRSHLLSDSTDPFNRAPLSVDDLIGWSHQDNTCIALNFGVQKILT